MPTINDATVVNSAYDTNGNGGRKLVRLDNGWLVSASYSSGTASIYFHVSKDNGTTFQQLCLQGSDASKGLSIESKGNRVYAIFAGNSTVQTSISFDATTVANAHVGGQANIDTGQTSGGFSGNSLTINEAKTELHATWASKNATYANSFNIRYAKGTINGDGSVTWGAVEQWTKTDSTTYNYYNPSISIYNGNPIIIVETTGIHATSDTVMAGTSTNRVILALYKDATVTMTGYTSVSAGIRARNVYIDTASRAQSSPSAIFVRQSVNGLANGRIEVLWHGYDATQPSIYQVRYAYSDDGGTNWSAMQKLTTQSNRHFNPSVSYDEKNNIYVYMTGDATNDSLGLLVKSNGTWGAIQTVHSSASGVSSPSAIEFIKNTTRPPVIFKDLTSNTVKFYGTWTVTTISVTPGSIGTKTDKANVLTYAITTDGTMSTITEKVNGVTVGTKTATSGQSLIAGLTQSQWDAVKFGKYADVTGGKNTLTVEMGTEKWTYTFDKRLATTDDILSVAKAEQDVANVFLPAIKSKLASAITSKGGTATGTDTWDALESAVSGITLGKKWASGYVGSGGTTLAVTGLTFKPTVVIASIDKTANYNRYTSSMVDTVVFGGSSGIINHVNLANSALSTTSGTWGSFTSNGFNLRVDNNYYYYWIAIE